MLSNKQLTKALTLATKMVISQDWPSCMDVCPLKFDRCEARVSMDIQMRKCVKPLMEHFMKQAKGGK